MDAGAILSRLARVLAEHGLEAVLIGNAAPALQGAPVTTVDLDFLFRKTPRNMAKLKAVAAALGAVLMRPCYPASEMIRLVRDEDGLQVDFMGAIHGIRCYESLRRRATAVEFGGHRLLVAGLPDIIRSKRAAGRPRDRAVLEILEQTLEESKKASRRAARRPEARK